VQCRRASVKEVGAHDADWHGHTGVKSNAPRRAPAHGKRGRRPWPAGTRAQHNLASHPINTEDRPDDAATQELTNGLAAIGIARSWALSNEGAPDGGLDESPAAQRAFGLKRVVFVRDRGMVTSHNGISSVAIADAAARCSTTSKAQPGIECPVGIGARRQRRERPWSRRSPPRSRAYGFSANPLLA
jgi:hypothetical protein